MVDSKDEHPVLRTIVYLTILYLFLFFSFFVPMQNFFERIGRKDISETFFNTTTIILVSIVIPICLYYHLVVKNNLEKIVERYKYNKINKHIVGLILFFAIFLLLFVGPTITITLFGGSISKWDFEGVLTPYLPRQ
jgi:cytochrome c biogenesis factor